MTSQEERDIVETKAMAAFERTAKAKGFRISPWEELHPETREMYREFIRRQSRQALDPRP